MKIDYQDSAIYQAQADRYLLKDSTVIQRGGPRKSQSNLAACWLYVPSAVASVLNLIIRGGKKRITHKMHCKALNVPLLSSSPGPATEEELGGARSVAIVLGCRLISEHGFKKKKEKKLFFKL